MRIWNIHKKRNNNLISKIYIQHCFINASEELFRDLLPLSAKTIKMCSHITIHDVEDLKLVSVLSIAVDQSCDINNTAQVLLFVRFMTHSRLKEELLRLLSVKSQTPREDIANDVVIECMDKYLPYFLRIWFISRLRQAPSKQWG